MCKIVYASHLHKQYFVALTNFLVDNCEGTLYRAYLPKHVLASEPHKGPHTFTYSNCKL